MFALVLLAAACTQETDGGAGTSDASPPTTLSPTTATTASSATATDAGSDWPEALRRVCLVVDETARGGQPPEAARGEEVRLALESAGLEVHIGESPDCEATLTLSIVLAPHSTWQGVIIGGGSTTCYAGAVVSGTATLSAAASWEELVAGYRGERPPSGGFVIPCGDYAGLPFADAWADALADLQARWWWADTATPPDEGPAEPEGLVSGPAPDRSPAWSPDGTLIAFVAERDGNAEIYLVAGDGTETRLTTDPGADVSPAWSPDGSRLAFASDRDGDWEIYVMAADGSGLQQLTDDPAADFDPAWSPDGGHVAFTSEREGNREIFVMAADGSGARRLTDDPADDVTPDWAPDGERLAFASTRDGTWGIYLMGADGSGARLLTDDPGNEMMPAWSPDGTRLAFTSDRSGGADLWLVAVDGWGLTRLTDGGADWGASWAPEGGRLVYSGDGDLWLLAVAPPP